MSLRLSNQGNDKTIGILLTRFISWSLPIAGIVSALAMIMTMMAPSSRLIAANLVSVVYFCVLLWARAAVRRGRLDQASIALGVGILLTSVLTAPLVPETLPILITAPFSAVAVTLPYLGQYALRRLLVLAWVANVLIVGLALAASSITETTISPLVIAAILIGSVPMPLVLLWQHHQRLLLLLEHANGANAALQLHRTTLEAQVQERTAELQALAEQRRRMLQFGQSLLATQAMDDVLHSVEQMLGEMICFSEFSLLWLDDQASLLRISVHTPSALRDHPGHNATIALGKGIASTVASERRGLLLNNAHLDPRSFYPGELPACEHIICLPIEAGDGPRGVFLINRFQDPPFTDADFAIIELFSNYLSLAIQNARRFELLRASEVKYRALFEEMPDAAYISTLEGHLLDANPAWMALFGYESRAALDEVPISSLYVNPIDSERVRRLIAEHGAVSDLETAVRQRDGQQRIVLESATAVLAKNGELIAYRGFLRDITERRQVQEELDLVFTGAKCLLWHALVEERGSRINWQMRITNEDAAQLFLPLQVPAGASYSDVWDSSKHPDDLGHMDATSRGALYGNLPGYSQEFRCYTRDGELRWLQEDTRIERIAQGRWRLIGVCIDVTERRQAQEELRRQAIHDPLTGLYNRRYMEESLERELHRAVRQQTSLGVIMLDIDHFKQFNDRYGHMAGDELLRNLGSLLQRQIRAHDIACRYGGEEFTLILPDSSIEDTRRRAEQLLEGARQMSVRYRQELLSSVTLSLGVAAYPTNGMNADDLLHEADHALYRAKDSGRNRVVVAITYPPLERGKSAATR